MAAGVSVIACVALLSAAIATGTVKGTVTRAGNPVVGAKVKIASHSDSGYGATAVTDKEGSFSFTGAPVGGVDIKVYDAEDDLLVAGKGELQFAGEVITLQLEVP
jgi:hypothetical protein